jgi:hypothetical protein
MLVADFHIHTKYSSDCKTEPNEILDRARKLNFNVLGIADHNTIKGAIETKKIAKDILILVGQEIKTEQGEIIIFGTEENLEGNLLEIIDKARERDLLIILPHPFDKFKSSVGKYLSKYELKELSRKIHAIEVFNSRCFLNKFNKEAQEFSKENKIVGIAGSDAHILNEIDNVRNFLNCEKNEEEIYKAIKLGKLTWSAKSTSKINFLRKHF